MKPHYFIICSFLLPLLSSAGNTKVELAAAHLLNSSSGHHSLSRSSFPDGFIFGTATSAFQVEGAANEHGRGPSIWDPFVHTPGLSPCLSTSFIISMFNEYGRGPSIWYPFVHTPGKIANADTADVADDQYHRYPEDIDLMHDLNFDAYRFSISWSRIFPNGTGEVNWQGVGYYDRLIDYLLLRGITPYACLYHFDLPLALEEKYLGMLDKQFIKDFVDYSDFCFKQFGDRVKHWFTFNEPRCIAAISYDSGANPPNRCSQPFGNCLFGDSGTEPYIAAHHIILAHAETTLRYREKYLETQKGEIGILLDFVWYEPLTRGKVDRYAAQRARDFHIGWFLHPLVYGEYPKTMVEIVGDRLPKFTEKEARKVKGAFDLIGINQYTTFYIYNQQEAWTNATSYSLDWHVGFNNSKAGHPIGPRAVSTWLYEVPWGMYKAVKYVQEHYGNPRMVLSENGMDQPGNISLVDGVKDTERVNYYKAYITELKRAIDEGANMHGYFAWSFLDNFEWLIGYTSRFGIVYVDRENDLARHPKMSAYWFQQMLKKNS